jgi:phage gp36-like protein
MSWSTLTEAKFLEQLSGPEVTALKTAALATAQAEPLTALLAKVVQEVRGYVAANSSNQLGEGVTIPGELEADAIAIARYRALNRLPVKSLVTPGRETEYKDAIAKLRDVAAGRFRIEQPETVSSQVIAGPGAVLVSSTTRKAARSSLAGL